MAWFMKFFYGRPVYAVKFINIDCDKRMFLDHIHAHIHRNNDIDLIEKYGLSIRTAKTLMGQQWFITDMGNLVRGETKGLMPLHVRIPIDCNLDFLSSCGREKMNRSYANVPVHIKGFHLEENGKVDSSGGFRILFKKK
ncbi:MAG: hypothetical protein A2937_03865 [Candidatus Yonathbacteria bacterium RIFCSPLOWO2_01_FULL_47_33b]|uniref:Uncharacterized protein n=1 Tax=Candidatus Yonathbacteria bacterium RIFCSPLOWO2_01_FULL_47_33b TaxID=1802727 RepID=A0A1G2SFK2_9BACT|nr:MAG: hypothetical protein A2937_03865 [Candidatus Yonathbacteria bacterium RIFCSPLOWO2_01_FULL_47_33b]